MFKKKKVRVWRPYWQISKQTSLACTSPPAVHLPPPIIVHHCWSLTSNQDTVQASGSLSRWLGFSTLQFCWFSSLCLVELRDLYLKTRWWRQYLWGLRKNIRNDIKIVASFLFKVQVSLRKHPFLLALRRWGRFAQRNFCNSATEIPYWWRKICPESGQKPCLVDGVVTLF